MAPCLSPSPSGSGRRLSELLEEKQEPFFLDLHLLEKGCSSRLLHGYDTALCWPAAGNDVAAATVLKRLASKNNTSPGGKKKRQHQPAGILIKLLLSKIHRGKADGQKKPAGLQSSDSFNKAASANPAAVAPAPFVDDLRAVKIAGEVKEKKDMTHCYGSDSDCYSYSDDDEKLLSPVSVLEHPFESSPVHIKLWPMNGKLSTSKNTMDVFRELRDAAYSPALLTQLLAKSDDHIKDTAGAADDIDEDDYYYGYRSNPKNIRYDDSAYWEAYRTELARVSELVASEVPNARLLGHADLLAKREDVGAGVAAAVLEALLQELVIDLVSC